MRRCLWLALLLAAVAAVVIWPRDDSAPPRTGRPPPVVEPLPVEPDSSWLIATDAVGRRLHPTVNEEDGYFVIRCPGFVTEAYFPHDGDDRPLRVALMPAATLRGRVVYGDEDHPAVGVQVECYGWPYDGRPEVTDKDGRFEVPDLNPADTYFPNVLAPGFPTPELICDLPSEEVLIVLGEGETLRGKIVDQAGEPVAGMPVFLHGHLVHMTECEPESFSVVSGMDGAFEFRGLDAGFSGYRVVARDQTRKGRSVIDPIDEGEGATCAVVVSERPRLRVRLLGPDGSPIEHARITTEEEWLQEEEWIRYFSAVVPGVYVSGPLSLGTQELSIDLDGWPPRSLEIKLDHVEERHLDVRLEDAHTLRGIVVDDTGRPVEGASVRGTETDAEGRFVLRGLEPEPVELHIEHDRHWSVSVNVAPTDDEHRITLPRAGTLTGRLEPVPESREVYCSFFSTEFDDVHERVDVLGRFTIRGLPSGEEFDITFVAQNGMGIPMRRVRLEPGEVRDVGVLRPPTGATLEGVVRDNHGRLLDSARMNLESRMQDVDSWLITEDDGSYRFEQLTATRAELAVYGPWLVTRTFELELAGRQVLDIVVIQSGLLAGTAKGAVELRLVPLSDGQPLRWNPEKDGTFSVNPAPGRYRLEYRVGAKWIEGVPVDIVERETTRVTVAVAGR